MADDAGPATPPPPLLPPAPVALYSIVSHLRRTTHKGTQKKQGWFVRVCTSTMTICMLNTGGEGDTQGWCKQSAAPWTPSGASTFMRSFPSALANRGPASILPAQATATHLHTNRQLHLQQRVLVPYGGQAPEAPRFSTAQSRGQSRTSFPPDDPQCELQRHICPALAQSILSPLPG